MPGLHSSHMCDPGFAPGVTLYLPCMHQPLKHGYLKFGTEELASFPDTKPLPKRLVQGLDDPVHGTEHAGNLS